MVYFHRSRLVVDGFLVGLTANLEDLVQVGDCVAVRAVPNVAEGSATIVDACPTEKVAIWVHKGGNSDQVGNLFNLSSM